MSRPTGLISDIPSQKDALIGTILRSHSVNRIEAVYLTDHFRFDLDQWPNGTCVQFALTNAIWAAQGIAGVLEKERILISPPALYYATLRRTHGSKATLEDKGSKPSQCVATLQETGCCTWDDWPHDPSKPNKCLTEPFGNLLLKGTDTDWIQTYRLDGWADERKQQIIDCFCLDVPRPVICGLTLDQEYEDLTDGIWPGRTGPSVGRHMVALCGFDSDGVLIATSWGPDWGVGGVGRASWDAILSLETTDLNAVSIDISKMPGKKA